MIRFWSQLVHLQFQPYEAGGDKIAITEHELLSIAQKCPKIRRLGLNNLNLEISLKGVDHLNEMCPHVEELILTSSECDNQVFTHLLKQFPRLKKIELNDLKWIESNQLDAFFSHHSHLTDFKYQDRSLEGKILKKLKSPLQKFVIYDVVEGGEDELVSSLTEHCRNSLQKLEIGFRQREPEMFHQIFGTFHQLIELTLDPKNNQSLNNLPVLPRLQKLEMYLEKGDQNVKNFLSSYPRLISLKTNVKFSSSQCLREMVKLLPNLRVFTSFQTQYTKSDLIAFHEWSHLECIELTTSSSNELDCSDFCHLVQNVPSLKKLIICDQFLIENGLLNQLRDVLKGCKGRRLWFEFVRARSILQIEANSTDESFEHWKALVNW